MARDQLQKNLNAFYALSPDTDEVLRAVYEREIEQCRERLVLLFTTKALIFQANADDDTLSVDCKGISTVKIGKPLKKSTNPIWDSFIDKAFGWGWVTVNQQGYCDGALVSFNGITPNVSLEVAASSIETRVIQSEDEVTIEAALRNGSYVRLPSFGFYETSPVDQQPVSRPK